MTGPAATQHQLERYAEFLARTTLEIERNLRPPEALREFMPPAVWARWRQAMPTGRFDGGPVLKADIGPPHLQRLAPTRAIASVTTRTDRQRWGALTLKLETFEGRWQATSLQRLLAATHYRTGADRDQPVLEVPLEQRLATARGDRDQARAALTATERRLEELPSRGAARRPAVQLKATWEHLVVQLDREIAALTQREQAARSVQRTLRRSL
jgi:hypothetical protein